MNTSQDRRLPHQHTSVLYFTTAPDPFGWLTTMSMHPITYDGITFHSAEALFQWMRFQGHADIRSDIARMKTPKSARKKAFESAPRLNRRGDWDAHAGDIALMRTCLELKLDQHPDLAEALRTTGDRILVCSSMRTKNGASRFWGAEFDESRQQWIGANVIGQIWMELRSELGAGGTRRSEPYPAHDHDSVLYFTGVREPYGWLGNMYAHPIRHDGKLFRTSEALFQWLRFEGHPKVQQEIFVQMGPMGSKMKARVNQHLLNRAGNWDEDESDKDLMRLCLRLKVEQHPDVRKGLLATGDQSLVENCSNRDRESSRFWGAVYNAATNQWEGENVLGVLWMELRSELRNT